MTFTPAQIARINKALEPHFFKRMRGVCHVCGSREWQLTGGFIASPIQPPGELLRLSDGDTLVFLPVVCKVCGYTLLFNVITIGLGDMIGPPKT